MQLTFFSWKKIIAKITMYQTRKVRCHTFILGISILPKIVVIHKYTSTLYNMHIKNMCVVWNVKLK